MKYQAQLEAVKPMVDGAKNILVVLPAQANTDLLAAGLAFYLSLKQSGKEATIVTESPILVENTNLFGVGEVKNTIPQAKGGDMVLSLENVVMPDGSVPALEKLDWYPEGANLNLVFHVVAGQRFEPSKVETKYTSGSFDLIVTIGVTTLTEMGNVYINNQAAFVSEKIFNIDNNAMNASFGANRLLDSTAPSFAQMVAQILPDLGLTVDKDVASNILAGVYGATANLTQNVTADTFMVVGMAMQAGGQVSGQSSVVSPQTSVASQPVMQTPVAPVTPVQAAPVMNQPMPAPAPVSAPIPDQAAMNQNFDLRMFQPPDFNPMPTAEPISPNPGPQMAQPVEQPAPVAPQQPVIVGEREVIDVAPDQQNIDEDSFNPQPDWLTPKVFKSGGSLE